jgi:hypothetical protein
VAKHAQHAVWPTMLQGLDPPSSDLCCCRLGRSGYVSGGTDCCSCTPANPPGPASCRSPG